MTVLITRSEPGASQLAVALREQGVGCLVSPLLAVRSLEPWSINTYHAGHGWQASNIPEPNPLVVIVLSAHAAHRYVASDLFKQRMSSQKFEHVAIGPASAAPLIEVGITPLLPDQPVSEGIVEMPYFSRGSQVWDDHWAWIVSGKEGRDHIAPMLTDRLGLHFCKISVYERTEVEPADWNPSTISVVSVASNQALEVFKRHWLLRGGNMNVPLLVPSMRLLELAQHSGFNNARNVGSASTQQLVEAICAMDLAHD
ncbi:MAG: uroporphyrinogen-III synthase [Pseudomonadota bacterium]